MEAIQLRPYQMKAIDAIQEALARKQRRIVVEMAAGCGKGRVLAITAEILSRKQLGNILIVVDHAEIKTQLKRMLFDPDQDSAKADGSRIEIETKREVLRRHRDPSAHAFVFFTMRLCRRAFMKRSAAQKRPSSFLLRPPRRTHADF